MCARARARAGGGQEPGRARSRFRAARPPNRRPRGGLCNRGRAPLLTAVQQLHALAPPPALRRSAQRTPPPSPAYPPPPPPPHPLTPPKISPAFFASNILPVGLFMAMTLWSGNAVYLYLTVSFIQMLKVGKGRRSPRRVWGRVWGLSLPHRVAHPDAQGGGVGGGPGRSARVYGEGFRGRAQRGEQTRAVQRGLPRIVGPACTAAARAAAAQRGRGGANRPSPPPQPASRPCPRPDAASARHRPGPIRPPPKKPRPSRR